MLFCFRIDFFSFNIFWSYLAIFHAFWLRHIFDILFSSLRYDRNVEFNRFCHISDPGPTHFNEFNSIRLLLVLWTRTGYFGIFICDVWLVNVRCKFMFCLPCAYKHKHTHTELSEREKTAIYATLHLNKQCDELFGSNIYFSKHREKKKCCWMIGEMDALPTWSRKKNQRQRNKCKWIPQIIQFAGRYRQASISLCASSIYKTVGRPYTDRIMLWHS